MLDKKVSTCKHDIPQRRKFAQEVIQSYDHVRKTSVSTENLAKFLFENCPELGYEGAWDEFGELAQRVNTDIVRDNYRKFAVKIQEFMENN